jgi:very-short-patch-repair endonuclease
VFAEVGKQTPVGEDAVKSVLKNEANLLLEMHLRELRLAFVKEHKFHPQRKWRFDYWLFLDDAAVEIEGGIWVGGRHTSGAGYSKDLEKYREAAAMGFRVFRFSTSEVLDGTAREFLQKHVCK